MIPEHQIEQVKDANDIVDVIGSYLQLRKKGMNYWAPCPFHDEKTPSFSVSPSKQIYHCFGCGVGGNVIHFVQEYENISFIEALKELAQRVNIPLEDSYDNTEQKSDVKKLHDLHDYVIDFYHSNLKSEKGLHVLDYLHKRGISDKSIDDLRIGYAPNAWDTLVKLLKNDSRRIDLFVQAGLLTRSDQNKIYDRFRDRLMFPIHNTQGHPVGFGGRILKSDAKDAKYLNSPESPVYHKSKILYGLHLSKETIRKQKQVLIVEGYMDFIQLYQAGFNNCVAGSGTAFTADQAKILSRYANEAILCYDSDSAGQKAAVKTGFILSSHKINCKILQLPSGDDPDSYLNKEGETAFRKALELRQSFMEFLTDYYQVSRISSAEKSDILQTHIEDLRQFSDPIYRELFLKDLSQIFNVDFQTLAKSLNKKSYKKPAAESSVQGKNRYAQLRNKSEAAQFVVLQLMLLSDVTIRRIIKTYVTPEIFSHKKFSEIAELILYILKENPDIKPESIPDRIEDTKIRDFIIKLLFDQDSLVNPKKLFLDTMRQIEDESLLLQLQQIEEQMKIPDKQINEILELQKQSQELTSYRQNLKNIYSEQLFDSNTE